MPAEPTDYVSTDLAELLTAWLAGQSPELPSRATFVAAPPAVTRRTEALRDL